MTTAEALKALDTTLKANAARPAAMRPLIDRSDCTDPRCTNPRCACVRKGKR
jgi:hypothetical protein